MISLIRLPQNYWKDYQPKRKTQNDYLELAKKVHTTKEVIQVSFSIYVAHYVLYRIKKSIKEQKVKNKRMRDVYKPLNPKYKKSKPYGTKNMFWYNTGDFFETIGVYQTLARGKAISHIGWRGNKRWHKDQHKLDKRKQITYLERRRPLIKPILNSVKSNIGWLWKRYEAFVLEHQTTEIKYKLH